jgi:hypothetical protein
MACAKIGLKTCSASSLWRGASAAGCGIVLLNMFFAGLGAAGAATASSSCHISDLRWRHA